MKVRRVFLGAPPASVFNERKDAYLWHTVSSFGKLQQQLAFPAATIEAASRRISAIYENIIFHEDDEESHYLSVYAAQHMDVDAGPPDETATITWLPATHETTGAPHVSRVTPLRPTGSLLPLRSVLGTQDTQATSSHGYSDASSVRRFPAFHFSIHALISLSQLVAQAKVDMHRPGAAGRKGSRKVSLLAAILEVEGPDTIRIKKGADAGKEVSLLKLILGEEDGTVCKLVAWRETAETWGGADPAAAAPGVKRGDIALFENVLASWGGGDQSDDKDNRSTAPVILTASTNVKSRVEICYRTMPLMQDDNQFRPDLRLGFSDVSVRKVAAVAEWFEDIAGLMN